jgi:hypothetical protein
MLGLLAIMAWAALGDPSPNWQPYPMEGGVAFIDLNSVLDNGRTRSIAFRVDVERDGISSYVTRIEIDCASRRFRTRYLAAYDQSGRELYNHRLGERPFSGPGRAGRLVDAACNHSSPRPDPVPSDAPSTFSRSLNILCGEQVVRRRNGDPEWLGRLARGMALNEEQRSRLLLDCEAYESGRSDRRP